MLVSINKKNRTVYPVSTVITVDNLSPHQVYDYTVAGCNTGNSVGVLIPTKPNPVGKMANTLCTKPVLNTI